MSQEPIDMTVIEELKSVGEQELVVELVQMFLEHAPQAIESISSAIDQKDAIAAGKAAHSLKSSSGNLGARGMSEACRKLEKAGLAGTLSELPVLLKAIRDEYAAASARLLEIAPAAQAPKSPKAA